MNTNTDIQTHDESIYTVLARRRVEEILPWLTNCPWVRYKQWQRTIWCLRR